MTQATELPNVLAAESLLLTLITFVYANVYSELKAAAEIKLGGRQYEDVGSDRDRVRAARTNARALAAIALIVGAAVTPPAANALWHFLRRIPDGGRALHHYNTVSTTLVLVTVGCLLLAAHAACTSMRLTTALDGITAPS